MTDLFELTGKVALVTGASSGMGRAIAETMGRHGATVIVSSNDSDGCEEVVNELKAGDIHAVAIPCDVSSNEEIQKLVLTSLRLVGPVDILISCVGVAKPASFMDIEVADVDQTMQINLQSAVYLTKLVLPPMIERKDGVLIYLGSIAGVRGNKSLGLYGITKAGLTQLARNLAVEFGPYNIRANVISPGMIDTPFSQSLLENKAFIEKRLAQTPLRRVGTPDEIAGVAVMLASKAGAFITGQNIIVDGGTTISDGN